MLSQSELCHAMPCSSFAALLLYSHLVAEILQPSEPAFLFPPDFHSCSDKHLSHLYNPCLSLCSLLYSMTKIC